jgi:hypothetical protein
MRTIQEFMKVYFPKDEYKVMILSKEEVEIIESIRKSKSYLK